MHERELDEELTRIEAQMASFQPGPSRLDRDRTMFLAGRAGVGTAGRPRCGWGWPTAFAAMTAVSACLLTIAIIQRQSPPARLGETPAQLVDRHDLDRHDRDPAVEPQPAVASSVPDAHSRRGFDPGRLWDVSSRFSAGLLREGSDPQAESVERWPERIREMPPSLPYAQQRRALLEEVSQPAGRNPGEPIPSFPLGV